MSTENEKHKCCGRHGHNGHHEHHEHHGHHEHHVLHLPNEQHQHDELHVLHVPNEQHEHDVDSEHHEHDSECSKHHEHHTHGHEHCCKHGHGHGHHDHGHAAHEHGHGHGHEHAHGDEHEHGCGHEHGHGHAAHEHDHEHAAHEHEHEHENRQLLKKGGFVDYSTHEGASIASVSGSISMDAEKAREAMRDAMSKLAAWVNENEGLIGHIKCSLSIETVVGMSITLDELTEQESQVPNIPVSFASIVFGIEPDVLANKVVELIEGTVA